MSKQPITTMWKYKLALIDDVQEIEMPISYHILHTEMIEADICIWAMVEPNAHTTKKKFRVYGTGYVFDDDYAHWYVGTCVDRRFDPPLVWHVFEVGKIG